MPGSLLRADGMAIQIIGESGDSAPFELPRPTVDIPGTETAAANHALLSSEDLIRLVRHDHPLVRGYAVEQAAPAAPKRSKRP